jgi:hypothetical protein
MKSEDMMPYIRDSSDGVAFNGRSFDGVTPVKKPIATTTVANRTRLDGMVLVLVDETTIVKGRTSPLAICLNH